MTIKSKNTSGVVSVSTGDTVALSAGMKIGIEAASLHNTSPGTVTISTYISPDTTSASGERVSVEVISSGEAVDVNAIIGQGYTKTQSIIMVADVAGVNSSISYTEFDGADA